MSNQLLTVKNLSLLLARHPHTIYKLIKNGEIPFIKRKVVGIRFRKEEIEEWLTQGSSKIHSLLESFSKVDLALDKYDKLFLKGVRMSQKEKTWNYPFGSVYLRLTKTGKEKWYIYYRIDGKRVREVVKNAQSRADALKVLQVEVADAFRGKHGFKKEEKRMEFKELAELYLENYAKINKKSWKKSDYSYLSAHLCPFFGSYYISDITPLQIEKYRIKRLNEGVSKSTVNRELATMRKMFNLAIDWDYVKSNPVAKIKFFSEKDNRKERILSSEEERRLIQESSEHLRPVIVTALQTGMRRGEILGITWKCVDLSKRLIRIENTKSDRSRLIPFNNVLFDELLKLKKLNSKSDYVFVNPETKKPYQDVKTGFNASCRRAGIKKLRFHDLRHTFASRLVEAGISIITVKELLGHSSVKVTERYTHSNGDSKKEAIHILAKYHFPKEQSPGEFVHTMSKFDSRPSENDLLSIS